LWLSSVLFCSGRERTLSRRSIRCGFRPCRCQYFHQPPRVLAISIEHIEAQKRKRATRIAGTSCNRSSTPRMDSALSHQKGTDQTIKSTERWVTTLRHLARNYLRRRCQSRAARERAGRMETLIDNNLPFRRVGRVASRRGRVGTGNVVPRLYDDQRGRQLDYPESLNLSDHEIKRKLWYAFVPLKWRGGTWQSHYFPNPSSSSIMATES
jgi:hypothetical protein